MITITRKNIKSVADDVWTYVWNETDTGFRNQVDNQIINPIWVQFRNQVNNQTRDDIYYSILDNENNKKDIKLVRNQVVNK